MYAPIMISYAIAAWISIFFIHRVGTMDPHNPAATPGRLKCALTATLAIAAALATVPASNGLPTPEILGFFGMFAMTQTVAVPFVAHGTLTDEEEPSWVSRKLSDVRERIGGAIILKVVTVVLVFLLPNSFGLYVLVPIILAGSYLTLGKSFSAALIRIAKQDKDMRSIETTRPPNGILALETYVFGCSFILLLLQANEVNIDPANWMGWIAFILGALLSRTL